MTGKQFLSPELIRDYASQNASALLIGKHVLYYGEISSTQDIAQKLARQGAEDGTVVIAEKQTRGKGRQGRSWISSDGGLYLSLILRPNLEPVRALQLPLVAGVAVAKAIKKVTTLQPRLKWPNDIIITGKKVGGILTETSTKAGKINHTILGIGLNVNTPRPLFPLAIRETATSLAEEGGQNMPPLALLQRLFCEFEALYVEFLAHGFGPIRQEWKAMSNTIGCRVKVATSTAEIEGEALDIDSEGFLLVRRGNGNIARIINDDIHLIDYSQFIKS